MRNEKEYFAFISYQREDEKWAVWLQHKLEHYKLPSNLNGRTDLPKEIRPIFRDKSELAGGVLADEIQSALEVSKYLIVICSPRAAQSRWVGKEVQSFIDMGRTDKIIPFIIGGKAHAQNPEDESFPSALLNLPPEQELLGINIDEMGRDAAAVKVVAQMFGLKFDMLWQRYEKENRRRRVFIVVAALLLAFAGMGIAIWLSMLNKRITDQNEKIYTQNEEIIKQNEDIQKKNEHLLNDSVIMAAQLDSINRRDALIELQKDSIALTNQFLIMERDNLKKANWKMMENQSHFISQEALQLVERGDTYRAIALLLEVLPDSLHPFRPHVAEAEKVLRIALDSISKEGFVPIAVLDGKNDKASIAAEAQEIYYDGSEKQIWILFASGDAYFLCCFDLLTGSLLFTYYDDLYDNDSDLRLEPLNPDEPFFLEGGAYKIVSQEGRCVLYRTNDLRNGIIHYVVSYDFDGLRKESFCLNKTHFILQDSIYDYLSGKTVRGIGLPNFDVKRGYYSNDDKCVIVLNLQLNNNETTKAAISVEDAETGKIMRTLEFNESSFGSVRKMDLFDIQLVGSCVLISQENSGMSYRYRAYSIPDLKQVYDGNNYPFFLDGQNYIFDYDMDKNLVYMKDARSNTLVKTMEVDMRYVNDNPHDEVNIYMLEDGRKLLITGCCSSILYDMQINKVIRQFQFQGDRYGGFEFDSNKRSMLIVTMYGLSVCDAIYGEPMLDFLPCRYLGDSLCLELFGLIGDYGGSFTKDESHIVYYRENSELEDGSYSVFVIPWGSYKALLKEAKTAIYGRKLTEDERRLFYLN